jgi:hypothetical protein
LFCSTICFPASPALVENTAFKLTIDGSTTAYLLTEDFGPGGDKGSFGFNQTTPVIDLLAAVGNAPGMYDVSYEVDYTYHYWGGSATVGSATSTQFAPAQ